MQKLLAREQISRVLHDYCRAVDRIDPELGYSVWHEDGLADYGTAFNGTGRGFIDWVCEMHRKLKGHAHKISNLIIEVNGMQAASETYVTAWIVRYGEKTDVLRTIHGRYLDTWSLRNGRWAIDKRHFVFDFDYIESREVSIGSLARRDQFDPSYQLLRL